MGTLLLFCAWIGVNAAIDAAIAQKKERVQKRRARAIAPPLQTNVRRVYEVRRNPNAARRSA